LDGINRDLKGYYPESIVEVLRRSMKNLNKISGVPAKIGTEHPRNTNLGHFLAVSCVALYID
jgi:hypothetical protein